MCLSIHLCSFDNVLTFAQFIDTMFTSVVNFIHFSLFTLLHIFTHCSDLSRHFVHLSTRPSVFNFTPLVTFSHFPFGFGLGSHMYTSTVCSPLCLLCAYLIHIWVAEYHKLRNLLFYFDIHSSLHISTIEPSYGEFLLVRHCLNRT